MPLHAITPSYGEAGLRERFLLEISRFPAADRVRAEDTLALASRASRPIAGSGNCTLTITLRVTMGLMFRVAVPRGCRRGELCGFRWADVELDKPYRDPATSEERTGALLTVERPIVQIGGKLHESKAKTRAGKHRVFLDHDTATLLREHRKAQLKLRLKAGEAWQDNDLVFCQDGGRLWNRDHVSKRFKKLAAQAGVPVVTLHEGGRHTANSLMQDAGVDQEVRMREVGPANKSVNDRCTHPLEQAHLAASEQTAALVRKAGKAS